MRVMMTYQMKPKTSFLSYSIATQGTYTVVDLEKSKGGLQPHRRWLLSRCLYEITLGRETLSTEFSIKGGSHAPCD